MRRRLCAEADGGGVGALVHAVRTTKTTGIIARETMPLLLCAALTALALLQTPRYVPGMYVSTPQGPIELITYAEGTSGGKLVLTNGSFEDVPTIIPGKHVRVLAAVPLWPPVGVLIATEDLFKTEKAEQRWLVFGMRKLNISSLEMRISDLESPNTVARLMKAVRATDDNPAYAFIIVGSQGLRRYYPIRLSLDE